MKSEKKMEQILMNQKKVWPGLGLVMIAVVSVSIFYLLTPQDSDDLLLVDENDNTSINETILRSMISENAQESLNKVEIESILYMREEEKLAWDVYLMLYDKWGLPIFENIATAENTHTNAIKTLIDKYEIEDPYISIRGKFNNSELQELYNTLIIEGSKSLQDALNVGAAIEEIDILDLEDYLTKTNNEDIILVFENLMKGSRNHLRAFVKVLDQNNIQYSPQYLSPEVYDTIISSPTEKAGPKRN